MIRVRRAISPALHCGDKALIGLWTGFGVRRAISPALHCGSRERFGAPEPLVVRRAISPALHCGSWYLWGVVFGFGFGGRYRPPSIAAYVTGVLADRTIRSAGDIARPPLRHVPGLCARRISAVRRAISPALHCGGTGMEFLSEKIGFGGRYRPPSIAAQLRWVEEHAG